MAWIRLNTGSDADPASTGAAAGAMSGTGIEAVGVVSLRSIRNVVTDRAATSRASAAAGSAAAAGPLDVAISRVLRIGAGCCPG